MGVTFFVQRHECLTTDVRKVMVAGCWWRACINGTAAVAAMDQAICLDLLLRPGQAPTASPSGMVMLGHSLLGTLRCLLRCCNGASHLFGLAHASW
jgi:hypothetical protein